MTMLQHVKFAIADGYDTTHDQTAREILEAMRDNPTQAMLDALNLHADCVGDVMAGWRAAFDAALAEEEHG